MSLSFLAAARRAPVRSLVRSTRAFHSSKTRFDEAFILGASRTPVASFNGAFKNVGATTLGAVAIKDALTKANVDAKDVSEVFMGHVVTAAVGQAPARQAALKAGLPNKVPCTTINKVCASGMKAAMFAAQTVQSGNGDVVIAGGMENMSQIPHYLPKARSGIPLGHGEVLDGIIKDGLWDAFDDHHMGVAAEVCATDYNITRADQDAYAVESYTRATDAWANGVFQNEIAPVAVPQRGKPDLVVDIDEEFSKLKLEKVPSLRPAFKKDGTVTAANASSINDGASALVIASGEYVKANDVTPLAKILAYADAAKAPVEFTTAPADAIPLALSKAGLTIADVDLFEVNEAFSVVALANNQILNLDPAKVNIFGGGVSLGHPIGSSGSRIIVTLVHALKTKGLKTGVAAICNGGGGASAIVVQLV